MVVLSAGLSSLGRWLVVSLFASPASALMISVVDPCSFEFSSSVLLVVRTYSFRKWDLHLCTSSPLVPRFLIRFSFHLASRFTPFDLSILLLGSLGCLHHVGIQKRCDFGRNGQSRHFCSMVQIARKTMNEHLYTASAFV